MAEEKQYSQSISVEQVKAGVVAKIQSAIAVGSSKPRQEIAEPENWWNLWALGPFQYAALNGPLQPGKVVRVGETFYVATVLWLNPNFIFQPGISACDLIGSLACNFQVEYCTADMCRVRPSTEYSRGPVKVDIVSGQCYYVDVQRFQAAAGTESCVYEMKICGRITGCNDKKTSMAGYATAVYDYDTDLFYPPAGPIGVGPRWKYDQPIRFMVYS